MADVAPTSPAQQVIAAGRYRQLERILVWGIYGYPAILITSLYSTWLAGWVALGHMPRPSLDDPKYISLLVDIPYVLTMGLFMVAPGALILGLCLTPIMVIPRSLNRYRGGWAAVITLLVLVLMWGATFLFLRADPWDVLNWYGD
ncbi:MAG: hypothetical protein ACI841_001531 [Planctomycetota bacterium]|jgi:hypothetical protein